MYKDGFNINELCKKLFFSSDDVTLNTINYLFNENFDKNNVSISKYHMNFIEKGINQVCNIIEIEEKSNHKKHCYNIEFQISYDPKIVSKMFFCSGEFIINKHNENKKNFDVEEKPSLKQCVIFFEENKNIEDTLSWDLTNIHPLNSVYKVPTFKFWEKDIKTLKSNKLYTLLPLKIFDFKRRLELIEEQKDSNDVLFKNIFTEIKEKIYDIVNTSKELYLDKHISKENLEDMLIAIQDIFSYLSIKYYNDEKINSEVGEILKYSGV